MPNTQKEVGVDMVYAQAPQGFVATQALSWNPQDRRGRGSPKLGWKRYAEQELGHFEENAVSRIMVSAQRSTAGIGSLPYTTQIYINIQFPFLLFRDFFLIES